MSGLTKDIGQATLRKSLQSLHKPTPGLGYVGLCRVCRVCRLLGKVRFHLRFG